jgi:hypothetical protein
MSIDKTYPGQLRRELYGAIRASWFRSGKIVSVLAKIAQYNDAVLIKDIIPLLWAKEEAVFFETLRLLPCCSNKYPLAIFRSWTGS